MKSSLVVGMCNAPRKLPTIFDTLISISDAGYKGKYIISQEPSEMSVVGKNVVLHKNENRLGCFQNHHRLLELLLEEGTDYILLLQDDFVYHKDFLKKLNHIKDGEEFGYYNLYSNVFYKNSIRKEGRNRLQLSRETAYQVSYFMRSDTVRKIMQHEFYQDHLHNYKKNQQVDACITEVCKRMGLPMYVHNPSLAIHIGHATSTLGHSHLKENDFRYFPV